MISQTAIAGDTPNNDGWKTGKGKGKRKVTCNHAQIESTYNTLVRLSNKISEVR